MLEAIENRALPSKEGAEELLRMMRAQQSGARRLPHFLHRACTVAHKTGDFPPVLANDVGIVYAKSGSDRGLVLPQRNHRQLRRGRGPHGPGDPSDRRVLRPIDRSVSSTACRAVAPRLWIARPWVDLVVGCGGWSLPLLAVSYALSRDSARDWAGVFYALALLANYPHYMATVYRAYGSRRSLRASPLHRLRHRRRWSRSACSPTSTCGCCRCCSPPT